MASRKHTGVCPPQSSADSGKIGNPRQQSARQISLGLGRGVDLDAWYSVPVLCAILGVGKRERLRLQAKLLSKAHRGEMLKLGDSLSGPARLIIEGLSTMQEI